MTSGNIPAGQIVQRLQSGEIIFRVGEGVQVGSVVNLRNSETGLHETVTVGKIIDIRNGDAYCSTFAPKLARPVPILPIRAGRTSCEYPNESSVCRAHKRTICPLCNRGHNQIECPYCKDE